MKCRRIQRVSLTSPEPGKGAGYCSRAGATLGGAGGSASPAADAVCAASATGAGEPTDADAAIDRTLACLRQATSAARDEAP